MKGKEETSELRLENNAFFTEVARILAEGHTVSLPTKGHSMFPFITGGRDSVVLRKQKQVGKGDIVLARIPNGTHMLHRIRRIEGDTLVLMGDGNVCATEKCRREDVLGTVQKIMRNGRAVCCDSPDERRKVRLWQLLLPLRRYLLAVCRRWVKWRGTVCG